MTGLAWASWAPGLFLVVVGTALLLSLVLAVPRMTRIHRLERVVRNAREELRTPESLARHKELAAEPGEYPGVVMVAGGPKYGPLAWHNIQRLARHSPGLPVHVFALDEAELEHWSMREAARQPHVTVSHLRQTEVGQHIGWKCKIQAILESHFSQVLFLDADNQVLEDVRPLFRMPAFQDQGAVFWPDTVKMYEQRRLRVSYQPEWTVKLWGTFMSKPSPLFIRRLGVNLTYEHESGQMLFDKTRVNVIAALRLVEVMCDHHKLSFELFHGDKDLYQLGFAFMDTPFHQVDFRPGFVGFVDKKGVFQNTGLIQRHPADGRPLFLHVAGSAYNKQLDAYQVSHLMLPTGWDSDSILSINRNVYSNTPVDLWTGEHPSQFVVHFSPPQPAEAEAEAEAEA